MPVFSQSAATQPRLYLTVSPDGGVLFDPEKDRLLKMNATGVEMWQLLHAGRSESEVAEQLARKYGVEARQIIDDVRNLVATAAKLGLSPSDVLLIEEPSRGATAQTGPTYPWYGHRDTTARPAPKRSTILFAIMGLTFFDCILSALSLEFLCRSVKAWPLRPKERRDQSTLIGEICSAVEKACVWYPKKALCLQRSAVTTCILRSYGIPAHLVVGVRPMPFLAHAWVEAEGSVVNDFPNVSKFYRMLTAY
jgi:Transglutaminase-like superfamily/Coenzyme PQQ synthesis protein D (PqqD)